ncbi:MAG: hypothetical protein KDJ88_00530 [Bauldia sp.]|nr:hypothetical protein [Bauldia sp.]
MEMTEKLVREFDAKDEDGNLYAILEYQQYASFEPINQPIQYLKGRKRFTLGDGSPVQDRDDGTLIIVESGTIVREV